jgi:3-phenylpropionate/cinnamic acid dioxygenase small subunit
MVIDGAATLQGSYNWTRGAAANSEDLNLISSPAVAAAYAAAIALKTPSTGDRHARSLGRKPQLVTPAENYDAGLPLGLIYATSRNMLKDRVSALREANVYEPQRYRHLVSSIKIVGDAVEGPEHVDLVANFLVVRTMQDGEMTIFGAGRYVDQVRRGSGCWKFASKTVVLDSRQIDTLLAIPI